MAAVDVNGSAGPSLINVALVVLQEIQHALCSLGSLISRHDKVRLLEDKSTQPHDLRARRAGHTDELTEPLT